MTDKRLKEIRKELDGPWLVRFGSKDVGFLFATIDRLRAEAMAVREKALEKTKEIIDNEPLGYRTEHEHKLLEAFAIRCETKIRALMAEGETQ